ncbi:MAG: hypothetical protein ACLQM8_08665 [Limisphaerales bacterium]
MSAINSVSSIASQYPPEAQSIPAHHGKGSKAPQTVLKAGNPLATRQAYAPLQRGQLNFSQTAGARNAARRNPKTPTPFQPPRNAPISGNFSRAKQGFASLQQDTQNSDPEETERDQAGLPDTAAQTPGRLLDLLV